MVYGQTGSGKSYTMEGYEYVLAESKSKYDFFAKNGPQGRDMRALVGNVD